jgi:hypothetical protein
LIKEFFRTALDNLEHAFPARGPTGNEVYIDVHQKAGSIAIAIADNGRGPTESMTLGKLAVLSDVLEKFGSELRPPCKGSEGLTKVVLAMKLYPNKANSEHTTESSVD